MIFIKEIILKNISSNMSLKNKTDQNKIIEKYEDLNDEQREVINGFFQILCGEDLGAIILKSEYIHENNID